MYSLCGDVEVTEEKRGAGGGGEEIFSESHESSCTIINKFEQPLRPK